MDTETGNQQTKEKTSLVVEISLWLLFFTTLKVVSLALSDIVIGRETLEKRHDAALNQLIKASKEPMFADFSLIEPVQLTSCGCAGVEGYDALMIVHSATAHFLQRDNYRKTYGQYNFTKPYKIKIVFFLGQGHSQEEQLLLENENAFFGDTVQGQFLDTYENLTYKAIMALKWVSVNCRRVKALFKVDDDIIFNVHRFFEEFWPPPNFLRDTIFCHSWRFAEAEREGKYKISRRMYREDHYPEYCSGFFVVMPPHAVHSLYRAARYTPFLWIDDVFIYGIVRNQVSTLQIAHLDNAMSNQGTYTKCRETFGARCKYWVTVLDRDKDFISTVLSIRQETIDS